MKDKFLDSLKKIQPWKNKEWCDCFYQSSIGNVHEYLGFMENWKTLDVFKDKTILKKLWSINSFREKITGRFNINSELMDSLIGFNIVMKINNEIYWNLDQASTIYLLFYIHYFDNGNLNFGFYLKDKWNFFSFGIDKFFKKYFSNKGLLNYYILERIIEEKEFLAQKNINIINDISEEKINIFSFLLKMAYMHKIYKSKQPFFWNEIIQNSIMVILGDIDDSKLLSYHYLEYQVYLINNLDIKNQLKSFIKSAYYFFGLYITIINFR